MEEIDLEGLFSLSFNMLYMKLCLTLSPKGEKGWRGLLNLSPPGSNPVPSVHYFISK